MVPQWEVRILTAVALAEVCRRAAAPVGLRGRATWIGQAGGQREESRMYHRTAIYAVGEDLLPEVEVEADDARVWIRFGRDMSLWLDYKQAGVLVDQLVAQLPPETEADYGGHLEVS